MGLAKVGYDSVLPADVLVLCRYGDGNVLNATGRLRMSYVIAAVASLAVVVIVLFIDEHKYNRDFMTRVQIKELEKEMGIDQF